TAFSGGLRYKPTTSVSLAASCGSVENLKFSRRQGCRSHLCQTSMMLAVDTPSSRASSRDDQWVTPSRFGGGSSVVTTIFTSSTDLGRPDLGRSSSALIPAATYRDRQWRTVGTDVPHRSATSVCGSPSAASSTILPRRARPASPALEEDILASLSQSTVRSTSGAATRIPRLSQTERNFPSATLHAAEECVLAPPSIHPWGPRFACAMALRFA